MSRIGVSVPFRFWDEIHGQTSVAPIAIELHPCPGSGASVREREIGKDDSWSRQRERALTDTRVLSFGNGRASLGFRLRRGLARAATALRRRLLGGRLLPSACRYRLLLAARRTSPALHGRSGPHRGAAASPWGSRMPGELTQMRVAQINHQTATTNSHRHLLRSRPAITVVAHDRDRFQSKPPPSVGGRMLAGKSMPRPGSLHRFLKVQQSGSRRPPILVDQTSPARPFVRRAFGHSPGPSVFGCQRNPRSNSPRSSNQATFRGRQPYAAST